MAALVIGVVMPRATATAVRALGPKERWTLPVAGLLLAAHFGLFLGGLATTSLPAAVALVSLEPLAVVVAAWIGFGIRPTRGEGAGVAVASVGAMIVASGAGSGEHRVLGDVLVLGAVVLYGAYVAAARGLRDAMPMMPYAASVYGVAAIALGPLAFVTRGASATAPVGSWCAVVALGSCPRSSVTRWCSARRGGSRRPSSRSRRRERPSARSSSAPSCSERGRARARRRGLRS